MLQKYKNFSIKKIFFRDFSQKILSSIFKLLKIKSLEKFLNIFF